MKGTVVIAAASILAAATAYGQTEAVGGAFGRGFKVEFGTASTRVAYAAADSTVEANAGTRVGLSNFLTSLRASTLTFATDGQDHLSVWRDRPAAPKSRPGDIDWVSLLSEQLRIDATMHLKRLTEPETRHEIEHSSYFGGYLQAVKGYFTSGARWGDGDPFVGNNINHPIMGSISSHTYMNNDRRCSSVGFGDAGYWSCLRRATVFSVLASFNWEWNPLLSESAFGHVGKFYTCANGKCAGEGGWSDFVMTPLGGLGISLMGDIARAKLWPKLDRHLSGNIAARILKNVIKVASDPGGMANAAFNLNFQGVLSSPVYSGRR